MALKIVVTAPLPSAMTNTTTNVKTGLLRSIRPAKRTSANIVATAFSHPESRTCSRTAVALPTSIRARRRASAGLRPRATCAAVASSRKC
jgi:hypothetical protein